MVAPRAFNTREFLGFLFDSYWLNTDQIVIADYSGFDAVII